MNIGVRHVQKRSFSDSYYIIIVGSRSGAHTQTQEPRFLPPPRQTRRAVFPQRAFPLEFRIQVYET